MIISYGTRGGVEVWVGLLNPPKTSLPASLQFEGRSRLYGFYAFLKDG